jgi:pimeloyl-ACP methyl ester carboxylesterase
MHVERGGAGDPVLVLLHGLGATAAVWTGLVELLPAHWPGSWLTVDLPGHGRSDPLPRYSFGSMATAIAGTLDPARRHVILGHSLGGVVALTLASGWFGVPVSAACGLGIKVRWTDAELAKSAELAARPNRVYPSREEAVTRAGRVAGLAPADVALAEPGIRAVDGGWRLSLDPAAFGVGAPDMPGLLTAARSPITLAAGELDPLSPADQLLALQPDPVILPALGHNAQVEDPAALLPLLERLHG